MFERKPLRDDVQKEIHHRIVDGRLAAGQRINETHLAADLGLSRTPLREAMITMAAQGHLSSMMGRGFAVPDLEAGPFLEIQELLHHLEPAALAECPAQSPQTVMELNNLLQRAGMKLNQSPAGEEHSQVMTILVGRWADLVLENCRNRTMVKEIQRLQALSARYWYTLATRQLPFQDMMQSYRQMYELLRSGSLDEACRHWGQHNARFAAAASSTLAKAATG